MRPVKGVSGESGSKMDHTGDKDRSGGDCTVWECLLQRKMRRSLQKLLQMGQPIPSLHTAACGTEEDILKMRL